MKENTKRPQDLISNYCEEIQKLKRINLTAIRKEMSRMNGLSSEVIRKYDDEIGGNKPEWLLMGCIAVGLEYKLPADMNKMNLSIAVYRVSKTIADMMFDSIDYLKSRMS